MCELRWQCLPLHECMERIIDYRGKTPPKTTSGIPLITAKIIKNGTIAEANEFISPAIYDKWMTRGFPLTGDIVMTTEAPLGEVAQISDPKIALAQRVIVLRGKKNLLDNLFLKYLLLTPFVKDQLFSRATGTTVLGIKQSELRKIILPLPLVAEQQAIATILGSLDDKIDLNRRMNETLEAMARAIFKDWFVDFGPTRAKMEGRAPYLAQEIWDLFPDALDDEGKPAGWQFGVLGDIATQVGQTVSPDSLPPKTPYIGLEHMPRRSIALDTWEGAGKVTSEKLAFKRGDFLFGKLRPYFHKVGIAPLDGICSTDIMVLNSRFPEASAFVISCISAKDFVNFTDRTSDGTKMPRTSWGRMEKYEICNPGCHGLMAFGQATASFFTRIIANVNESRTLAQTRDFLLPKLMSGEIRVKDAEKAVEQAL